jgi:16S rRNA C1402 (ribose-2'-O) methylase RsmI
MTREIRLRQNTIVKLNENKAEIIVESKYRLFITLNEKKVIAKYSDTFLTIEFDKFDSEKLAKKIHTIVEQTHKFSILLIQEVLELIKINNLYDEINEQIKKLIETKDIDKLQKVYEFLNQLR